MKHKNRATNIPSLVNLCGHLLILHTHKTNIKEIIPEMIYPAADGALGIIDNCVIQLSYQRSKKTIFSTESITSICSAGLQMLFSSNSPFP